VRRIIIVSITATNVSATNTTGADAGASITTSAKHTISTIPNTTTTPAAAAATGA
jgi:hypothetical protein